MTNSKPAIQNRNEIDFLFELRVLLDRYDVDLVAVNEFDGILKTPFIEIQFNRPYGVYQFQHIASADEIENDINCKSSFSNESA